MHLNNELIFLKYAKEYFKDGMKVLEIGPEGSPSNYCKLVNNTTLDWYGLDISLEFISKDPNPKFILSDHEYNYPIEENTFDIVVSGGVMCNVKQIWLWMAELKRIVKSNGLIITITPVSWPYAAAPVDCWRVYPEGFRALNDFLNLETVLAKYDSLEIEHFNYDIKFKKIPNFKVPGVSICGYNYNKQLSTLNKIKLFYNRLIVNIPYLRSLMNPIQIAYDSICIAKKNT